MDLTVTHTAIPGLLVLRLPVHRDSRGWFKENWQREKMTALGLPDFAPVQHSLAHNGPAGTTRGIHAEPWDKLVSLAAGQAFGAWVDLRSGPSFGTVHTESLDEATAVFVPRGVGNSYQTVAPDSVYSYLVNAHWSPDAAYTHLNLADTSTAVPWPIPLSQATISERDRHHPYLSDVVPIDQPAPLILGGGGQLGQALQDVFPGARAIDQADLDLTDPAAVAAYDFRGAQVVINAAAYTAVDGAEDTGRTDAWAANARGVAALAGAAQQHRYTLVHFSTDYVFDGTGGSGRDGSYTETDPACPVSVYGQSKAAGDMAVLATPSHYLLRTSWLVGRGGNFVATMRRLAREGRSVSVVDDQLGRLTFADELARATAHLLRTGAACGVYNVTGSGSPATWAEIARAVFEHEGRDPADVTPVTTSEYAAGAGHPFARRPARSVLDLTRLEHTGFEPADHWRSLHAYLEDTVP